MPPGTGDLVDRFASRLGELVAAGLDAIQREVPAYVGIEDPALLAEVRASLAEHTRILVRCLRTGTGPAQRDLEFVRQNVAARAALEIPLADYLHAFRVFHRVAMDAILCEGRQERSGDAAFDAA